MEISVVTKSKEGQTNLTKYQGQTDFFNFERAMNRRFIHQAQQSIDTTTQLYRNKMAEVSPSYSPDRCDFLFSRTKLKLNEKISNNLSFSKIYSW
jgi:hypothetical protein